MYGYPSIIKNINKATIIEDACQCLGQLMANLLGYKGKQEFFHFKLN